MTANPIKFQITPWPEGKPMRQMDELGLMFKMRDVLHAVAELQRKVQDLGG